MLTNAEPASGSTRIRFVLDLITTMALLAGVGFVIWTNWPTPPPPPRGAVLPQDPVSLDGATTLGRATAQIVLLTYTDFQCPFCRRFARATMPRIRKDYVDTGKVQLAIRHLPLPIHPQASGVAAAAACAGRQGRFWEMHDLIFEDPKLLDKPDLTRRATQLGLDVPAFERCREDPAVTAGLEADRRSAETLRIASTPLSLIGIRERDGRVRLVQALPGAVPFELLSKQLDAALRTDAPNNTFVVLVGGSLICAVTLASVIWLFRRRREQIDVTASH